MISYLKGTILKLNSNGRLILDVGGVGYEVFVPSNLLNSINKDQDIDLWIYSHIREDSFSLYGFFTEKEKEVFTTLLGMSGIGPKTAIGILSSCTSDELMEWVESEDIDSLSRLPKVGKKSAKQMILSLKGKWTNLIDIGSGSSSSRKAQKEIIMTLSGALSGLGFKSNEIKHALDKIKINKDTDLKEGIKQALTFLHQIQ